MKEIKIIAKFRKINFHLENKFRFETVGRDNDWENSKKTELVLQKRNSKRKIEEWNLDLFACRGTCSIQGNGMRKGDSELGNQKSETWNSESEIGRDDGKKRRNLDFRCTGSNGIENFRVVAKKLVRSGSGLGTVAAGNLLGLVGIRW
jgi:hypothetical protein